MSTVIPLLLEKLESRHSDIQQWFEKAYEKHPPNFYSSVDLRHSGHKLVPVDTNLFPAGFNHLSDAANQRAVEQIHEFIEHTGKPINKVLIVPENHTRNVGYLDNLQALRQLFVYAGLDVMLGSLTAEEEPLELEVSDGTTITQCPLVKDGNRLKTSKGYEPDLIVMNNDMVAGSPEILRGVTQCIVPPTGKGWYRRKKSIHFDAYAQVAKEFAAFLDIDPWLIAAQFHKCGRINFKEKQGMECVAIGVERVLTKVRAKYEEYGIEQEPYVFIKADSGTYGMGIMTVRSGEELGELNKKIRNKMNVIKEGVQSTEVMIQEGVPTIDAIESSSAEPMLYLVNGRAVGGAYRVNDERDAYANLNSKGMSFKGMCDESEKSDADHTQVKYCDFGVLGMIAQLATLAASREEYGDNYSI
ncbi:MAG: glutamate--cysteine ligase [Rickettsiales bacterium]|nr:glutamate--cysteine ligase [Rickettsiales bacterium]